MTRKYCYRKMLSAISFSKAPTALLFPIQAQRRSHFAKFHSDFHVNETLQTIRFYLKATCIITCKLNLCSKDCQPWTQKIFIDLNSCFLSQKHKMHSLNFGTLLNINKHYKILLNAIKHYRMLSNIIECYQTL